jgi:beta-glucanase (GH16 family)
MLVMAAIGVYVQIASKAAGPFLTVEPENGAVTTPAAVATDIMASGSKSVRFTPGGATPPANPLPVGHGQTNGPAGTWNLKLNENFDGTALNTSIWSTGWQAPGITPPVQSQETACYDPQQVVVGGGLLRLIAVRRDINCNKGTNPHPYASGAIESKGKREYSYGYFEANMKLDGSCGGVLCNWPAWWLDGTGTWPLTGELDVMEGLGGQAAANWHGPVNNGAGFNYGRAPAGMDWSKYHTFAAEWAPGVVTAYYDGVKVGQYASSQNITSAVQFLILGMQMSPQNQYGGPVKAPSEMAVDWVRVWQR